MTDRLHKIISKLLASEEADWLDEGKSPEEARRLAKECVIEYLNGRVESNRSETIAETIGGTGGW